MELEELVIRIKKTQSRYASPWWFLLRKRLLKKLKKQSSRLDDLLLTHLSEKDPEFSSWVQENMNLLSTSGIKFKVTDEGGSPWTYMTKSFRGKIHGNGYLYFKAKNTAFEVVEILSHYYPSKYIGRINALGDVVVVAAGKAFSIIGSRVPSAFIGAINPKGGISFEVTDSWFEIDGHVHVNKIIADPFKGKSSSRRAFLQNRSQIRRAIQDWKNANGIDKIKAKS